MAGTLAHETGHSFYGIPDEYVTSGDLTANPELAFGFGMCQRPEYQTSMMAASLLYWCDANTHITAREVEGFPFTLPRIEVFNCWDRAKEAWVDLVNHYSAGNAAGSGDYITRPAGELTIPPTSEPFCVFEGDAYDASVLGRVMVVVDGSGSMNYTDTFTTRTAFQAAISAGLGYYNQTPAGSAAGLSTYNSEVTRRIEYAPRASDDIRTYDEYREIQAEGSTDICEAISDSASQIRGPLVVRNGRMVLLSDGLPTTSGCNTPSAVLDAAYDACRPNLFGGRVSISTLAFGDADVLLLEQITESCGGDSLGIPRNSPERPLDIQMSTTRASYAAERYQEALFRRHPFRSAIEETILVPEGTTQLDALWFGEEFFYSSDPDLPSTCHFATVTKTLLDPSGNPAGFDPVPPSVEQQYQARTIRVINPAGGIWRMRADTTSPCRTDNPNYTGYVPRVGMVAQLKNPKVRSDIHVSPQVVAANEPVTISARLDIGPHTSLTGIDVSARVSFESVTWVVPMNDSGNGGDEAASDGVYTGVFNSSCSPLGPGTYRAVVEIISTETATPVVKPLVDSEDDVNLVLADPVAAHLLLEEGIGIKPCAMGAPVCPFAAVPSPEQTCAERKVELDAPLELNPGQTVCGIRATVTGMYLGTKGIKIGVAPHVAVHDVEVSYDAGTKSSELVFCITAEVDMPPGEYPISVQYGSSVAVTPDLPVTTCDALSSPLPHAKGALCAPGGLTCLPAPELPDCAETLLLRAEAILQDGQAVAIPFDEGFCAELAPGTYAVRWTLGTVTQDFRSADQLVDVVTRPTLYANGVMDLADRSTVVARDGLFGTVANAGAGPSTFGVEAVVGDLISQGPVFIRDRGVVNGFILTASDVETQNGVIIAGPIREHESPVFPDLPELDATFPPAAGPVEVMVGGDEALLPGSYDAVILFSDANLTLTSGTYYFASLDLEPGATVTLDKTAGPIDLFVEGSVIYRGAFLHTNGAGDSFFLGLAGTGDVVLEAPLDGTVVAPQARLVFGAGSALDFVGEFFARDIIVRPDVTVRHQAYGCDPQATLPLGCENGVKDPSESDIDCGGACGPTCATGSGCSHDEDCVSNSCLASSCAEPQGDCSESTAIDLGGDGNNVTVDSNGCVRVASAYPAWWGVRTMQLQNTQGGSYPVPFTWSNACTGAGGSGVFAGDWQALFIGPTGASCTTLIDLGGAGGGTITLRYWGA